MSLATETQTMPADLAGFCRTLAERAKLASRTLAVTQGDLKNRWLLSSAVAIERRAAEILDANAQDVMLAPSLGLNNAAIDRLALNPKRLAGIRQALINIANLSDPVGEVLTSSRRPNGLDVTQIRVPLGVVFMIYESRPNVTVDAAAICLKSGNAAILRGGKEAIHTNRALHHILADSLVEVGLPSDAVQFITTTDRAAVGHLLKLPQYIDLAIPRGGESLIRRVVAEAQMPVLKHYMGNCHIFVDASAEIDAAVRIILNAKTQRPGVCNAAETLLVHQDIAPTFLPLAALALDKAGVELRGDAASRALVVSITPAQPSDWDTEFLDLILAVAVVDSLESAISHITRHSSGHTEAILTRDLASARKFVSEVDSSAVVVNASTRFNDGGQLGLGAEIGISTDKYHARGPCGLRELTTTKWVIYGDGQIRE